MAVIQLPAFPSVRSLDFSILETIQNTLRRYISSSTRNDSETYIETYAKHTAHCALQSVVWGTDSRIPEQIEQLTLLIAQRAAYPIAVHTLIDLSVVYAQSYPAQLQLLFQAQYSLYPSQLTESITKDVLPTFTTLLSSTSDTYKALASKRKISESIVSFLAACSSIRPLIRPFAHSEHFIRALASLYQPQLTLIAESYGGSRALLAPSTNDPDDWSRIWIQTKIALIDSFHIVFTALSDDLASQQSQVDRERLFTVLFALLDLAVTNPASPPTPFLDLSLIADYQHAYGLSDKLSSIFNHLDTERDPRLDLLETSLAALLSGVEKKNPGVLTTILRSKTRTPDTNFTVNPELDSAPIASTSDNQAEALDSKAAQILAILPHLSHTYVTRLLQDNTLGGNVERVLEGLLDGSLASESGNNDEDGSGKGKKRAEEKSHAFGYERRNIFDEDEIDAARTRVGKQDVGSDLLQDRSAIERMKRDILRRVAEMEEAEAELFEEEEGVLKGKDKATVRSDDEDETGVGPSRIRLLGDGESDTDASESTDSEPTDPETIIEQAYLRDPGIFDRDANTRRGKGRIELRKLTGWADEQIEGWRVMLERTPGRKARLEEKHAFRGNVKGVEVSESKPGPGRSRGYGGRGKRPPRGGAGNAGGESSRGSKRGSSGRGGGGSNRKRGHDRKVARAGGGVA